MEIQAEEIVKSWYWQMAESHNYRWEHAAKTMVLYYESAPLEADVAQAVMEYLKSRENITELVIGHKKWTFEEGWNTRDAWYQTASAERWSGTESTKVRLYWALTQAGSEEGDGWYVVENGCKYLVSHEYYWDVAAEPELPASSSGISYTIQGMTRDKETGLYTYIIERRETVQQDVPRYKTAETIYQKNEEEQHLGVKAERVATTGAAAGVSAGVATQRKVTKNPDCTSDIVNAVTTGKKVLAARVTKRNGLRGVVSATVDRNLSAAEGDARAAAEPEAGETRTIEKTDLDQRDVTVEKTIPLGAPKTIAESCEQQESVHTDTKVEAIPAEGAITGNHVTVETNKEKQVSTRLNEDGVTADRTTTTRVWKEKRGGGSMNSGGVVETTTERRENTTQSPAPEAAAANKVVEIDEQPNDHGSKTTVKRVTTYREKRGGGSMNSGGVVETTTERRENTTTSPAPEAGAANKVVEIDEQPNDHGSKTTVKRVTTYREKCGGGSVNSGGVVETTTERKENTTESPAQEAAAPNKVVEIDEQPNDHGSKTTVKRVTTYNEETAQAVSNFATETVIVTAKTNTLKPPTARQGTSSAQPNGHGSMSTNVAEYVPKPIDSGWLTWESTETTPRYTYTYECGLRVFKNLASPPVPPKGKRVSPSVNINRYGLYDGTITYSALKRWADGGSGGGTHGGIQNGSIEYTYVSDYTISTGTGGDISITPVTTTVTLNTRTYYGRGNEGSEALDAANGAALPGLHLRGRTYLVGIISDGGTTSASAIVRAIETARAKLQAALANRANRRAEAN